MTEKGASYSAILHGIILFFLIFGLPDFLHREPDIEPQAISVDILPIAPISNVKTQEKAEKPVEKKKIEEKKTEKKATPAAKKEEKKEAEPLPTPKKDKPVKKKPPEKKKEEPKKKDDDLESVLKSVKDQAKAEESKKPTEKTPNDNHQAKSDRYNAQMPLSMSEIDAIKSQFIHCWQMPAGAKDAYNLVVWLNIELTQDGQVTKVELARDQSRYGSDSFFRAAADAAIRAVHECSPLKNLPADKYNSWREMELDFDPKNMLY